MPDTRFAHTADRRVSLTASHICIFYSSSPSFSFTPFTAINRNVNLISQLKTKLVTNVNRGARREPRPRLGKKTFSQQILFARGNKKKSEYEQKQRDTSRTKKGYTDRAISLGHLRTIRVSCRCDAGVSRNRSDSR